MVHGRKSRPYLLFLFDVFPSGSITIYPLGKVPRKIFLRALFVHSQAGVVRPYPSNCSVGFGAVITPSAFVLSLLGQRPPFLYPCPPPISMQTFLIHHSAGQLPDGFHPKAPFHLLLEAPVLPVFMKAKALRLIQAVNLRW